MARKKKKSPIHPFRSLYEENIGQWLKENKITYEYEAKKFEYHEALLKNRAKCRDCGSTNLVSYAWYTPDFFVGNHLIIEAKGRFTAADRRKILAVRECIPELNEKLVMMFMRNNKLNRRANSKYTDWCDKHGVDYTVGTELKEDWL